VSEPFGIAPLEAISNDVPVLISKQSGVSEILKNALKVDFWDVDEMANKIVAVLRHGSLHKTLREQGSIEIRKLSWIDSAHHCVDVYEAAIGKN
jgi:glycosyltransferase involved in cell wall biosynthesis